MFYAPTSCLLSQSILISFCANLTHWKTNLYNNWVNWNILPCHRSPFKHNFWQTQFIEKSFFTIETSLFIVAIHWKYSSQHHQYSREVVAHLGEFSDTPYRPYWASAWVSPSWTRSFLSPGPMRWRCDDDWHRSPRPDLLRCTLGRPMRSGTAHSPDKWRFHLKDHSCSPRSRTFCRTW